MREHVREHGLDLHEVAVLAAIIENVVHDDALSRLKFGWRLRGLAEEGSVSLAALQGALDVYMLTYLPGIKFEGIVHEELIKTALDIYPNWNRTRAFVHELISD